MNLTTTNTNTVTTVTSNNGGVEARDLQIPNIILVQKMSKVVDSHGATPGDIWDMMENKKLGNEEEAVEIVPLALQKSWLVYDVTNPRERKFLRYEAATDQNSNYAYHDTEGGVSVERVFSMNWLVLLKNQVALGEAIPYRISFKSSGLTTAKKLATMVARSSSKTPVFGKTYYLTATKQSNDKGTFFVYDVAPGETVNEEVLAAAKHWQSVVLGPVKAAVEEPLPFEVVEGEWEK